MADPTAPVGDIDADLRRYFAITTAVASPPGVVRMTARSVSAGRSTTVGLAARGAAVLAVAGLVLLGVTHLGGRPSGGAASLSARSGAGSQGLRFGPAVIVYPGVDTAALSASGVTLSTPVGHGAAAVGPAAAQSAASSRAGGNALPPAPAVLVYAELANNAPTTDCLCWAVDVPLTGGVSATTGGTRLHTELVLVDARSARVVAVLTGNGIP